MGWNGQPMQPVEHMQTLQLVEFSNNLEIFEGQTSDSHQNIIDIEDNKSVPILFGSCSAHFLVQDVRLQFFVAQMKCFPRPLAEI